MIIFGDGDIEDLFKAIHTGGGDPEEPHKLVRQLLGWDKADSAVAAIAILALAALPVEKVRDLQPLLQRVCELRCKAEEASG